MNDETKGRTHISRVVEAFESEFWAIRSEKLQEIAAIVAAKAETGMLPAVAEVEAARKAQLDAVDIVGGAVAVIPLHGTIARRLGSMSVMSGGASLDGFSRSFAEAMDNPKVSSIVIDVHSPGGTVYGVAEAAKLVRQGAKTKRVVAVGNHLIASGAYWLVSGATEIVISPSGEAGSIGVFTVHFDRSEAQARLGVKPTIIQAGVNKAETSPHSPLSEDALAHQQSMVDAYYSAFLTDIALGRGVPIATVEERFGQGRTFDAARLVERGIVDRVATLDEVIEELLAGNVDPSRPARSFGDLMGLAAEEGSVDVAAVVSGALDALLAPVAETGSNTGEPVSWKLVDGLKAADNEEIGSGLERTEPVDERSALTQEAGRPGGGSMKTEPGAAPVVAEVDEAQERAKMREEFRQAEAARVRDIRATVTGHGVPEATVDAWIGDPDVSAGDVSRLVLEDLKTRQAEAVPSPVVRVGEEREAEREFGSFGDQLQAIYRAEIPNADVDPRLLSLNAAVTGSGATVPADGGFLIQHDFTEGILARVYDTGQVASRVRRRPIGPNSNGLKTLSVDETSRATGSRFGGIQMYWADEADTATASKPKFRKIELSLNKLLGFWYATEEILEDSVALQGFGEDAFSEETQFMVENAIFRGSGSGQPLGFLNSDSVVEVAKESGQVAETVTAANVVKMRSRMYARSLTEAVWFVNQDVEPLLQLMTVGDQPVYMPPGGLRDTPYGSLLGRPVIPVEYGATVGSVGDIVFADMSQYLLIDKGSPKSAWSMHVRFLNDEQTFRITYRVDGQPIWNQPLTPFQGTNTQSPFVTLAVRS